MPGGQKERFEMVVLYPPGHSEFEGVLKLNREIARIVLLNVELMIERHGPNEAMAWAKRFLLTHRLKDWRIQEWLV